MNKRYRVYNLQKVPLDGGRDFFDVISQKEAIKLCYYLNENTPLKWVWSDGQI